jgi:hypothetical protein
MCTVTFIPRKTGYLVGMNRDEKLTRVAGLPPVQRNKDGRTVIYPSEPSGGTWISLNDSGTTFALVNWYSVLTKAKKGIVSRGQIIPSISTTSSSETAKRDLAVLPLAQIKPFRLIGIFWASRQIKEWQWDLQDLVETNHGWRAKQWISSGFDEPTAQKIRSHTFRIFRMRTSFGRVHSLRRLHSSHTPEKGPFSTCMHGEDAITVSYTEVRVSRNRASLQHIFGPPCEGRRSEGRTSCRIGIRSPACSSSS